MEDWEALMERVHNPIDEVSIGVVGKYVELEDAYKSLREALIHGGLRHNLRTKIHWIEAESLEDDRRTCEAAAVRRHPRSRRIRQARHSRNDSRHSVRARRESAVFRNLSRHAVRGHRICAECLRAEDANSTEFDANTPYPVIYKLRDLLGVDTIGGTMRLGAYPANLEAGLAGESRLRLHGDFRTSSSSIRIQPARSKRPSPDNGLIISGVSPDKNFVEIVELADHPWFLGCQFHPEFKSKPLAPASAVRILYRCFV